MVTQENRLGILGIALLISAVVLLGCSRQELASTNFESSGTAGVLKIWELAPSHDGNPGVSLVRGTLQIDNRDGQIDKIDVSCLELELNGVVSSKVYIDSVAHVLTDALPVAAEMHSIDLYWTIHLPVGTAEDVKKVKLVERIDCALFE